MVLGDFLQLLVRLNHKFHLPLFLAVGFERLKSLNCGDNLVPIVILYVLQHKIAEADPQLQIIVLPRPHKTQSKPADAGVLFVLVLYLVVYCAQELGKPVNPFILGLGVELSYALIHRNVLVERKLLFRAEGQIQQFLNILHLEDAVAVFGFFLLLAVEFLLLHPGHQGRARAAFGVLGKCVHNLFGAYRTL